MENAIPGGGGVHGGGAAVSSGAEASEAGGGPVRCLFKPGDVPEDIECCGSSNLAVAAAVERNQALFPAAAAALGSVWRASPTKSHIYSSGLGGVE